MAPRSILLPYPSTPWWVGSEADLTVGFSVFGTFRILSLSHRVNPHSRHFPTLPVNLVKVVSVSFRFISTNLDNFGNKSRPRPALDLNDDIQRVRNVGLDGPLW